MEIVFYNHVLEKISLNTQFAQAIFFEICKTKLVLYLIIAKSSIHPLIFISKPQNSFKWTKIG